MLTEFIEFIKGYNRDKNLGTINKLSVISTKDFLYGSFVTVTETGSVQFFIRKYNTVSRFNYTPKFRIFECEICVFETKEMTKEHKQFLIDEMFRADIVVKEISLMLDMPSGTVRNLM